MLLWQGANEEPKKQNLDVPPVNMSVQIWRDFSFYFVGLEVRRCLSTIIRFRVRLNPCNGAVLSTPLENFSSCLINLLFHNTSSSVSS